MTLFRGRWRVESNRWAGWDYWRPGTYFITILTRGRARVLSRVVGGEVVLSPIGRIVAEEWRRTEVLRHNVKLDAWVVMPNHFHALIHLTDASATADGAAMTAGAMKAGPATAGAATDLGSPARLVGRSARVGRLEAGSLGAIVGQFKGASTRRIRAAELPWPGWRSRYHDIVVQDAEAYRRIRQYILDNPRRWRSWR